MKMLEFFVGLLVAIIIFAGAAILFAGLIWFFGDLIFGCFHVVSFFSLVKSTFIALVLVRVIAQIIVEWIGFSQGVEKYLSDGMKVLDEMKVRFDNKEIDELERAYHYEGERSNTRAFTGLAYIQLILAGRGQ